MNRKLSQNILHTNDYNIRRKSLLEKTYSSVDNETKLINAVARGDLEDVKNILAIPNLSVNAIRKPGWSALHHACKNGNKEIVKLLLKNGADINLRSEDNLYPLEISTLGGHFELSMFLIENGAILQSIVNGMPI
ncbi:protein phosphatase 1 regulatory subunit 27 [Hydra vulgaris]|uniref:protein phosphatase 1 regulatory subunit 27 n=1 Tax=Hydra vulgaris TaxID=6087 RepID=UPI001F5F21E7|nr:protein phosphatase 1 regulatory subunit 27-like [Hydra vulgaris]